jgi:Tol biopolymer transport system component/predicted Ser/Thr protein kinase
MTPERLRQIQKLYLSARDHDPSTRPEFLAQACGSDEDLRREVETLLPEGGGEVLERPALEIAAELLDGGQFGPGLQIGAYRIESQLGAGGMGDVFLAVDTRLGRKVALKTCREQFSERFHREARAISLLNHAHICTLYDVGPDYLVMELVEGETLSDRLKRGKLSIEQTIQCGSQIAGALAAAHAKGIIHRDLKPGNIMLTKSGVKVLDFGLAKSPQDESLTASHAVMGTPAYMAPEQREGKECDARADVYALGLVLCEMATGNKSRMSADLPPRFGHIVERCLTDDPESRWQAASDVKAELEWAATTQGGVDVAKTPRRWLRWVVAAFALAFAAVCLLYFRAVPTEARVISTTISPPGDTLLTGIGGGPLLSPDGRRIVLSAIGTDGKARHWVRSLDAPAATLLPLPEDAWFPFWSPDSRSLGFFTDEKLERIDVAGGPAITLADAPSGGFGGSWNPQGIIVFSPSPVGRLQQVPAGGRAPKPATQLEGAADISHRFPWFLPDGRHFLFQDQAQGVIGGSTLRIGSLDATDTKTVGPSNSQGVYSSGYLLFLRDRTLMAQPFDAVRLVTTGDAVPIAEHVQRNYFGVSPFGLFSVSRERLLAYQVEAGSGGLQLTWFNRSGQQVGTLGDASDFISVEFSPDRRSLAATTSGPDSNVWIYEVTRGLPTRFTSRSGEAAMPVWSPDGRSIVYWVLNPKGGLDLYRKAANAEEGAELLYSDGALNTPTSWSSDGKFLLFNRVDPHSNGDIWAVPLNRGGTGAPLKPFPWLATASNEGAAKFSPDGRWVVYNSNEASHDFEIYVAPFPGPGGRRRISAGEGRFPRWRADGREIFYSTTDGMLMAVGVSFKGADIEIGPARPLGIRLGFITSYLYDVSADGQRILAAVPVQEKSPPPLTLVENWTQLLRKK